jgi:hypothetical protein
MKFAADMASVSLDTSSCRNPRRRIRRAEAGGAGSSEKTQTDGQHTVVVSIRWQADGRGAFLAAALLGFQRMEREKTEGEAGVHARQLGTKKAGGASEGMAVEQLDALCGQRRRENSD